MNQAVSGNLDLEGKRRRRLKRIVTERRGHPVLGKERVGGGRQTFEGGKGGSFEPDFLDRQGHSYGSLTSRQRAFGREATRSACCGYSRTTLSGAINGSKIALSDDDELGGEEEGWKRGKRTGDKQSAVEGNSAKTTTVGGEK